MKKNFRFIICLAIVFNIISPLQAHAYLDPGTGSLILQILGAAVIGVVITFRSWFHNIKSFFTGKKSDDDTTND